MFFQIHKFEFKFVYSRQWINKKNVEAGYLELLLEKEAAPECQQKYRKVFESADTLGSHKKKYGILIRRQKIDVKKTNKQK